MSQVTIKSAKSSFPGCIKSRFIPQAPKVLLAMITLMKVTFEATVTRPTKKLGSLVNINNNSDPFRRSTSPYNTQHPFPTPEMDINPATTQVPPAMATLTDQAPPSPRRFTISTFPTPALRTRKNGGNGQCTHITTTRLYSEEFRCALCLRTGSFGWVYRCTQDRELLLDEDMEGGFEEKLDKFCDILPKSITPRKRSAAARVDKLSFLTEISDEAMKSYTPEQLKIILGQRAYVLEQVSQPDIPDFPDSFYENRPLPTPQPNPPPGLPVSAVSQAPSNSNNNGLKPWFPLQGGECQFKCCHFCRPSLKERSFLSLNGIADGDIPATSITGFGFHLQGKRPVALVEHVKNLGLRPNPPPDPSILQNVSRDQSHHPHPTSPPLPPKKRVKRRPTSLGLGIFASEAVHPSASPAYIAPPSPRPLLTPKFSTRPSTPTSASISTITSPPTGLSITLPRPTTPILNSFEHQALISRLDSGMAGRRHSYSPTQSQSSSFTSSFSSASQGIPTLATTTPLPPPTPSEQPPTHPRATCVSTATETETEMEINDQLQSEVSRTPLQVKTTVAATNEDGDLHVTDIITQF